MIFLNGKFTPKDQACISVMDRGFLFGDGVYEVIPVYAGKIFRLSDHLTRLQNSLDSIQISNPYTPEKYQNIFDQLLEQSPNSNQAIYLQITRGVDTVRKHSFNELTPTVFIELNPLIPKTKTELENGYHAITHPDFRWERCDIKATSLLANIIYSQQAKQSQVEEVILHRDQIMIEGATSNVFTVKGNTLFTHPTGKHVLSGITRNLVIESARHCGLIIKEVATKIDDIFSANEVWISSSTREVMPIINVDSKLINNGKIGQHWSQVYDHYQTIKNA